MISSENRNEEEFKKLSYHLPDLIFQFTRRPDGTYHVPIASKGIENIFGCKPEDVKESFEPIVKVMHPEDQQKILKAIEKSANELTDFAMEARILIPGRPIQWVYTRSTPEKLEDGSITWYGFSTNMTEQKLALEKITALSKKQEAILKAIPDLIFVIGEDKVIYEYHSSVKDLLAAPPEVFLGKKYSDIIPGEASAVMDAALMETTEKGISSGQQYQLNLPIGDFWFELSVAPIEEESADFQKYIVVSTNISDLKSKEERIQQLSMAVEQSSTSILITDIDGNLQYANSYFYQHTGYTKEESIGQNLRFIQSGKTNLSIYEEMWNTIKSGSSWKGEFLNKKKNGDLFWEEAIISPVKDANGNIKRFLSIKTDITTRKATIEKLRKIAWSQSHQVRGPLTDILGIINLMKMEISSEEKNLLLSQLEIAAHGLDKAIHEIVDETQDKN